MSTERFWASMDRQNPGTLRLRVLPMRPFSENSEPNGGLRKPENGSILSAMPNIKIYDYVLERLASSRGQWPAVAEGSGVSRRTLEKIARREIADPGVSHIQSLADYFMKQDRKVAQREAA